MIKLLAILGAIAFTLYSVSGPVLVGFGVLAFVLIVLWQATKLVPEQSSDKGRAVTDAKDAAEWDLATQLEDTSFIMCGRGVVYHEHTEQEATRADCVSAWMIMLSEADELSQSSTESDQTAFAERAESIFKRALSTLPDDETLDSSCDLRAILWALFRERSNSQWLLERFSLMGRRLDLDWDELVKQSQTVDTASLLGENWEERAEATVTSLKSFIKNYSQEDLASEASRIGSYLRNGTQSVSVQLEIYESRAFETSGHFNWGGNSITQTGLSYMKCTGTWNRNQITSNEFNLLSEWGDHCYVGEIPIFVENALEYMCYEILVGQTKVKHHSGGGCPIEVPVIADIRDCWIDEPKYRKLEGGSWWYDIYPVPYPSSGPCLWVFSLDTGVDIVRFDVTEDEEELLAFLQMIKKSLRDLEEMS